MNTFEVVLHRELLATELDGQQDVEVLDVPEVGEDITFIEGLFVGPGQGV